MRIFMTAAAVGLAILAFAGAGAHGSAPGQNDTATAQNDVAPADDTRRLNDAASERLRQQIEARQRVIDQNDANRRRIQEENERRQREYQEQMRARDAANAAEQARYDAEMARFRAQQAASQRQAARRGGSGARSRASAERATAPRASAQTRTASTSGRSCAQQVQRNRQRGRAIGGVVGGVAGFVGGRNLGAVGRIGLAALSAPVGALIGDAIASRLDCREQEQAALATEQAVEGGVGTTVSWRSETRSGVSGTSTVTAIEAPPAVATPAETPVAAATAPVEASPCLTVTDVIIVDGEETRAPKRMCRRPPANRYVRV